jgi:hypothetical protein
MNMNMVVMTIDRWKLKHMEKTGVLNLLSYDVGNIFTFQEATFFSRYRMEKAQHPCQAYTPSHQCAYLKVSHVYVKQLF